MLEKKVSKENLFDIKKYLHTTLSETVHLGVADKWLINKVVDKVYEERVGQEILGKFFLAMVKEELRKYRFEFLEYETKGLHPEV